MLDALNDGGDARPGSPITADSWAAKASPTPNRPISAGFIPARPGGGEPRCWSRRPGTVGPHPGVPLLPGCEPGSAWSRFDAGYSPGAGLGVAHSRASRQGVCECARVRRDSGTRPVRPTMLAQPNLLNRADAHENREQGQMVTQDARKATAHPATAPGPTQVLLIEDDDADALLVEELLLDAAAPIALRRARSLAEAKPLLPEVTCALLDLGLPDTGELQELRGVRWLAEHMPPLAVVVLTGVADEHLGAEAVRAGAQDYLVKGQVDGAMLNRVIRYAIERLRSEEVQRQLREAQIYARENSRLERGLLPSPLLSDPRLTVATQYRPGGGQMLLGGDFFDVVEAADGWVHTVVGDVCGRGPEEAALGVCLRVAWRTMVLSGRPMADVLSAVQQMLEHERQEERLFATLCMMSIAPDRSRGRLHLAGHPQPLLITPGGVRELAAPV